MLRFPIFFASGIIEIYDKVVIHFYNYYSKDTEGNHD